jgi:L-fucose mutarotase
LTKKSNNKKEVIKLLKHIPSILCPDLLKILMETGHGDEIVIADGNFPAASVAQRLIRLDGHGIPKILEAILNFFPLDTYVELPVGLMAVTPGDNIKPVIWDEYRKIILESKEPFKEFEYIERFAFYERARKAYAIIATGESALYANIILKKGVVV